MLLDHLQLLPGHRLLLRDFIKRQKLDAARRLDASAAHLTGSGGGGGGDKRSGVRTTSAQRSAWKQTVAQIDAAISTGRRGRDGKHAWALVHGQPGPWGRVRDSALGGPRSTCYTSRVRILTVNGKRTCVFDDLPTPNWPPERTTRRAATLDEVHGRGFDQTFRAADVDRSGAPISTGRGYASRARVLTINGRRTCVFESC